MGNVNLIRPDSQGADLVWNTEVLQFYAVYMFSVSESWNGLLEFVRIKDSIQRCRTTKISAMGRQFVVFENTANEGL